LSDHEFLYIPDVNIIYWIYNDSSKDAIFVQFISPKGEPSPGKEGYSANLITIKEKSGMNYSGFDIRACLAPDLKRIYTAWPFDNQKSATDPDKRRPTGGGRQ